MTAPCTKAGSSIRGARAKEGAYILSDDDGEERLLRAGKKLQRRVVDGDQDLRQGDIYLPSRVTNSIILAVLHRSSPSSCWSIRASSNTGSTEVYISQSRD